MTSFSDWLNRELVSRDLSPADLSRLMKKDQGIISRIIRGERKPSPDTLDAISNALHLPPEDVFRAAGILPPAKGNLTDQQRQLIHLAEQADEQTLDLAIAMLEAALRQREKPQLRHAK